MKNVSKLFLAAMAVMPTMAVAQQVAHFDMSLSGNHITESVSGTQHTVLTQLPAFTVKGVEGDALRFDGYSNYIKASLPAGISTSTMTISVLLAPETYPMMNTAEAENVPTFATICGNLDDNGRKGFALLLSSQGDLKFSMGSSYSGGYAINITGNKKLPRGVWSRLTAVYDKEGNAATLYLNGEAIGTSRTNRMDLNPSSADFMIGKDATDLTGFGANLNTFCGLIDDIAIYNKAMSADEVAALSMSTAQPDFIYPESRYTADAASISNLWRPRFHGMPSGGWTNESHGMTYADGKYHVFFQKNANGPYMARLHWGHISSPDLCTWTEEPIAFGPAEPYDIKGCWSGCVFTDADYTGGTPYILYTAVDNAKATICQATPADAALIGWNKTANNPLINGRPQGLSDDFRDPYFFTANGKHYIIVGTSKDGMGACTLHEYKNGSWTNDGSIFFKATSTSQHGTFWEMPNVTPMGGDKFLFTCTPLNTGVGVRTLCWVGTIGTDGKFTPTSDVQYLEMGGISKDGYGLLSPTIYQHDGKTLMLGIVPDKLPTSVNLQMGWAHNYSLPREVSITSDGTLVQRPYSGLTALRCAPFKSLTQTLNGTAALDFKGRHIELNGEFEVADGKCGLTFLKGPKGAASLTYDPALGTITLDLTTLPRQVNDRAYGGIYTATLPQRIAKGETLGMHVYLDGSIADVFINDTWAFSVRVYPLEQDYVETEVFAESATNVSVNAWTLDASNANAIDEVMMDANVSDGKCYDLCGRKLAAVPSHGMYIMNGKKYMK